MQVIAGPSWIEITSPLNLIIYSVNCGGRACGGNKFSCVSLDLDELVGYITDEIITP